MEQQDRHQLSLGTLPRLSNIKPMANSTRLEGTPVASRSSLVHHLLPGQRGSLSPKQRCSSSFSLSTPSQSQLNQSTATTPVSKRQKLNLSQLDPKTFADVHSSGLATRLVQYHESSLGLQRSMSVNSLYNPLTQPRRRSVASPLPHKPNVPALSMTRIAPPERSFYCGNTLPSLLRSNSVVGVNKSSELEQQQLSRENRPILHPPPTQQDSEPTRSVLEELKEISRKRINSGDGQTPPEYTKKSCQRLVDFVDHHAPTPALNTFKRQREQQLTVAVPLRQPVAKQCSPEQHQAKRRNCSYNNDIASSLSSSCRQSQKRKLYDIRQTLSPESVVNASLEFSPGENAPKIQRKVEMESVSKTLSMPLPPKTVVPPSRSYSESAKPKLTLFNAQQGEQEQQKQQQQDLNTPDIDASEYAGIQFVKPKPEQTTNGIKNPSIERTQKTKLAIMLSGLRGELYQEETTDEADTADKPVKAAIEAIKPLPAAASKNSESTPTATSITTTTTTADAIITTTTNSTIPTPLPVAKSNEAIEKAGVGLNLPTDSNKSNNENEATKPFSIPKLNFGQITKTSAAIETPNNTIKPLPVGLSFGKVNTGSEATNSSSSIIKPAEPKTTTTTTLTPGNTLGQLDKPANKTGVLNFGPPTTVTTTAAVGFGQTEIAKTAIKPLTFGTSQGNSLASSTPATTASTAAAEGTNLFTFGTKPTGETAQMFGQKQVEAAAAPSNNTAFAFGDAKVNTSNSNNMFNFGASATPATTSTTAAAAATVNTASTMNFPIVTTTTTTTVNTIPVSSSTSKLFGNENIVPVTNNNNLFSNNTAVPATSSNSNLFSFGGAKPAATLATNQVSSGTGNLFNFGASATATTTATATTNSSSSASNLFSFGAVATTTATAATTTHNSSSSGSNLFNFGAAATTTATATTNSNSSSSNLFNFGATATTTATAATTSTNSSTNLFSFGAAATTTATATTNTNSSNMFSFGAPTATTVSAASTSSVFSFKPAQTSVPAPAATVPAPQFGSQKSFSFGGAAAPAASEQPASNGGGFAFGQKSNNSNLFGTPQASTKPTFGFGSTPAATPAAPAPTFGGFALSTAAAANPSKPFSFGGNTTSAAPSAPLGGNLFANAVAAAQQQQQNKPGGFSFGGAAASTPAPATATQSGSASKPFSFGAVNNNNIFGSPGAPSPSPVLSNNTGGAFQFGGNNTAPQTPVASVTPSTPHQPNANNLFAPPENRPIRRATRRLQK